MGNSEQTWRQYPLVEKNLGFLYRLTIQILPLPLAGMVIFLCVLLDTLSFFFWGFLDNLKLQYFGHLMRRVDSLEKTLRDWGLEEKGTTEDEMAGWHH